MRIILVEDDKLIAESLSEALTDQHYVVDVAADGQAGWELVESFTYDLILLDVMLPKLDGISFCKRLRSQGNQTPIILLTAKDTSTTKIIGLDAGADDYVAKPFDLQELLARIRALLRRGGSVLPPMLKWKNLQLDPSSCEVTFDDQPLHLTPKEYSLLELFLRNSQRIFSCAALIDHLWTFEETPTEDTVRSHIKGLRQKLKAAGISQDPIETVYGIGYRLRLAEKGEAQGDKAIQNSKFKIQNLKFKTFPHSPTLPYSPLPTPHSSQQNQIEAGVMEVWQQVKGNLSRRVAVIEEAVTRLQQESLSEELLAKAKREAHKLAGSLGMFGSDEGSRLAQEIELLFANEVLQNQVQIMHLSQLVVALHQELQHIALGESSTDLRSEGLQADTEDGVISEYPDTANPTRTIVHSAVPEAIAQKSLKVDTLLDKRPLLLILDQDRAFTEAIVTEATNWGIRVKIVPDPKLLFSTTNTWNSEGRSNADDVKELIAQESPDVVLLDFCSPDTAENALTLLTELTTRTPPVPVVVLTAQDSLIDRVKIARLGGSGILQKPVFPAQVLETVTQVLQNTRSTAEARVLVVDDDPQILTALHTLLVPWGLKVYTLDNSLRFLDVLAVTQPDLLVLDVEIPEINGIEICKIIRNYPRWSGLPILFLTAHNNAETMHQVFAAGADDYVSKPVVGPEIVTRILNRLQRSRLLRSMAEIDPLTGITNHRKSTQDLTRFFQWSTRHRQPFCFAILQLDDLKQINHQYGHATGDHVLSRFGELLRQMFHTQDAIGRWGGTEFVVGMLGMTKRDGVRRLSEVLNNLRQLNFIAPNGTQFHVSFTAGVVQYPQNDSNLQELYQAAEIVLNQAKAAGRNRVL